MGPWPGPPNEKGEITTFGFEFLLSYFFTTYEWGHPSAVWTTRRIPFPVRAEIKGTSVIGTMPASQLAQCTEGELNCISEAVYMDPTCAQVMMGPFKFVAGFAQTLPAQPAASCTRVEITGRYTSTYVDATDPANPVLVDAGECVDPQCTQDCFETFRTALDGEGNGPCLGPFENDGFEYYIKHSGNIGQPNYIPPAPAAPGMPEPPKADGTHAPMHFCEPASPLCVEEKYFSDAMCTLQTFDYTAPLKVGA
jgi:hypothetical protein